MLKLVFFIIFGAMQLKSLSLILISVMMISCSQEKKAEIPTNIKMNDPHSFANPAEARITNLNWEAEVNFEEKVIFATATYDLIVADDADSIILDTRDLVIESVTVDDEPVDYEVGDEIDHLGQALRIPVKRGSESVSVTYKTSPSAEALQWLDPVQTAGKKFPFLFTQSQAILARTWIPIQDSPGVRFTYTASVKVPAHLMAVMSARNPRIKDEAGIYNFEMPQPIPAYLMALSVGDLQFAEIGARTGVYAEPSVVEKAAYEFEDMENMLTAAEELYGKYAWERYDVIVLPPSFPFGGMENPRLTFATPTILAGDKSLTSLIAHELAHSWSGNVVTNANWNDFWLNEGFTVYFEMRIMEKLYGQEYANMLRLLGYQALTETVEDLGEDNPDTKLKLDLEGRNPDEGMTDIAYEKGSFFLTTVEKAVGREKFDVFLKNYFEKFAFEPMTTSKFMDYLGEELLTTEELRSQIMPEKWVFEPGIPKNIFIPVSDRFNQVERQAESWWGGTSASSLETQQWTTHEWLHFLRSLPDSLSNEQMQELDDSFNFTESGNSEILGLWFIHVVRNEYRPGYEALKTFLVNVGRRKFLTPIYGEMVRNPDMMEMARNIYQLARPNYHSVSYLTIDKIVN